MTIELNDLIGQEFPDFQYLYQPDFEVSLFGDIDSENLFLISLNSASSNTSLAYSTELSEFYDSLAESFVVIDILLEDEQGNATSYTDTVTWVFQTGEPAITLGLNEDETLKQELKDFVGLGATTDYPVFLIVDPATRQVVSAFSDYIDPFEFTSYVTEVADGFYGGGVDPNPGLFDEPGELFPNLELTDQQGTKVNLLDAGGTNDLIVLSICGIWCRPCQVFSSELAQIQQEVGDKFDFVELLIEDRFADVAFTADAQFWEELFGLEGVPILTPDGDMDIYQAIYEGMNLSFFPSYVVLDRATGQIQEIIQGYGGVEFFSAQLEEIADNFQPEVPGLVIDGGNGADDLQGDAGDDEISGGNGSDMLFGDDGNDVLDGGNGSDLLIGGRGNDVLTGGRGPDVFRFGADFGEDVVTDFELKTDKLDFGGLVSKQDVAASSFESDEGLVLALQEGQVTLVGLTLEDLDALAVL